MFLVAASALALVTLFALSEVAGFEPVWDRLQHVNPIWFLVAFGAEIVAYLGYVIGYREVSRVDEGPKMGHGHAAAAVAAGFGPFVTGGGFALDLHAFKQTGISDREARVRVLGLGALEYATLAPAACIASIQLLAAGAHTPTMGLTLPWAVAVPLGFVAALWAMGHRQRFQGKGWLKDALAQALESIYVLKCLFARRHLAGPLGATVYWFGEIVCLWACLHAFAHGAPNVELLLIGYATGYALTRRTLPLGGAGAVEALLPFALYWTGVPLAAAVLAVFTYRVFNFWLPVVPAVVGMRSLRAQTA
ncbi:MAG: lysylphosphatidylglycerol synthase domain-containing protein [Gaiellaceae bacterium]